MKDRAYIDSNVIIDSCSRYIELRELLLKTAPSGNLLFPYTDEQLIEATYNRDGETLRERLQFMSDISLNLRFENSINACEYRTYCVFGRYEDIIKTQWIIDNFKQSAATFVSKEDYDTFKTTFRIEPNIINNLYGPDVFVYIDKAIEDIHKNNPQSPASLVDFFNLLYHQTFDTGHLQPPQSESEQRTQTIVQWMCILDLCGYGADNKGTYDKGSRFSDNMHAATAVYYNFFVSRDKRLLKKAAAIYSLFHIGTKCIHIDNNMDEFRSLCGTITPPPYSPHSGHSASQQDPA